MRSPQDVIEDHLQRSLAEDLDADLTLNFAEDCMVLTSFGNFQGREGARRAISLRRLQLPNAAYQIRDRIYHGELALLEWSARTEDAEVEDGADSFLIQDGVIRVMTISFTPIPREN